MRSLKHIQYESFNKWLKTDRTIKQCFILSLLLIIFQFALFKFFYPFPNFMPPDSENYIESAWKNDSISTWPVGYSKFVRLISSFTNSHFVLTSIQYLFLEGCILYFLFTVKFIFRPVKWLFILMLLTNILSPLILHISNYVSSDSLFIALSLLWLTQLYWIQYNPTTKLLFIHGIVLLFAFTVRYNALYYPLISLAVIFMSSLTPKGKAFSMTYVIFLIGLFTLKTESEYYKLTGIRQFSAFGGWQIASNALYGYAYSSIEPTESIPPKFRRLHAITNAHMDSLRLLKNRPDKEVAVYYLWNFKSPLRVYMNKYGLAKSTTEQTFFKRWASVAPLYFSYGKYLILKHPTFFIKHYALPNLIKYYVPPVKFLGAYNMGIDTVNNAIQGWFHWKNNKLPSKFRDKKIIISEPFSVLFGISNFVFVIAIFALVLIQSSGNTNTLSNRAILITFFVWLINMLFSVISAPIELRYVIFPLIVTFSFSLLSIAYIINKSRNYHS